MHIDITHTYTHYTHIHTHYTHIHYTHAHTYTHYIHIHITHTYTLHTHIYTHYTHSYTQGIKESYLSSPLFLPTSKQKGAGSPAVISGAPGTASVGS